MKSIIKIALITFAAAAMLFTACDSGSETKSDAKSEMKSDSLNRPLAAGEKIIYQCPMCKDQKSDKPGKCPKCGMDMEKKIVKDTIK